MNSPRFSQIVDISSAALRQTGATRVEFTITGSGSDRARLGQILTPSTNDPYFHVEVIGLTASRGAIPGAPTPPLDTFLTVTEPNNNNAVCGTVPIEVEIPASIKTPNGFAKPVRVKGVNEAFDAQTLPAVVGVPAGKVALGTAYDEILTMTVLDQFGNTLNAVYNGAQMGEMNGPVETDYFQTFVKNGQYDDPVGEVVGLKKNGDPVFYDSTDPFIARWVFGDGTAATKPLPAPTDTKGKPEVFTVEIGGNRLLPFDRYYFSQPDKSDPTQTTLDVQDRELGAPR